MPNFSAQTLETPSADNRRSSNWDLRNSLGNYSTIVITQIISALFSFASVWVITHYLGKESYGVIVAIIAASQIIQMFVNWTCTPLARFGVEEFVETGKISKAFWGRTLIFLPSMIFILAGAKFWLPLITNWLKLPPEIYWLIVMHFIVTVFWLHIQQAMLGAKLPRLQGVLLSVERILIFGSLLLMIVANHLSVISATWAYILPPLIVSAVGLWKIKLFIGLKSDLSATWMKAFIKYSLPLFPWVLIGYFSTGYLDAVFISQYLSKADLGIYAVATQANGILLQFPTLANSLLLMLFVTLRTDKKEDLVKTYLQLVLPLLTFISATVLIVAATILSLLLPLVFGSQFSGAGEVLWLLAVGITFVIPYALGNSAYSLAISASYISTIIALVGASSNLIFNAILIPRYGLFGCAWATVLSLILMSLVLLLILHFQYSIKNLWTWQATLPSIAGLICFSSTKDFALPIVASLCVSIVLGIIYRTSIRDGFQLLLILKKKYL